MAKRRDVEAAVDNEDDDVADDQRHNQIPTVGLWILRASAAPIAVIFRRGPTKQVRLVRWDLRTDDFQRGQWMAARAYADRSRISPDGVYVDYVGIRRGNEWRAIAKVPYFTPLAVREPTGWVSPTSTALPPWLLRSGQLWPQEPLDGWQPVAEPGAYPLHKPHPTIPDLVLQRRDARPVMDGYASWTDRHAYDYRLFDARGDVEHDLGTADWGDWHPSGDLAVAREGLITRIPMLRRAPGEARVIADFNGETFEKLPPPPRALVW